MANRTDYYFRQKVTEAELDLGFELLEKADRDLAANLGIFGIVIGAEPAQHSPVPDSTIDLNAPGKGYNHLGQRIFLETDHCFFPQTSADLVSVHHSRWMFGRLEHRCLARRVG